MNDKSWPEQNEEEVNAALLFLGWFSRVLADIELDDPAHTEELTTVLLKGFQTILVDVHRHLLTPTQVAEMFVRMAEDTVSDVNQQEQIKCP